MIVRAGFEDAELVAETGFDSSPKTRGVLLRARKPSGDGFRSQASRPHSADNHTKELTNHDLSTFATLDDIVQRAVEMGAEHAKIIDTDSIVVQKWVRWKCAYGCPMYAKDGFHPPDTPAIEEVKEVLGEYARALLVNGRDGHLLSRVVCRLEGEAYASGYYKAFAMTALPTGMETPPWPGGG